MDDYESQMEKLDAVYEDTDAAARQGRMPDGRHQAQIVQGYVDQGKYGWQLTLQFANKEGTVMKWIDLENEDRLEYTKMDLLTMGFQGKLSSLKAWVEAGSLEDLVCDVSVKTKDGTNPGTQYTNVYINKVLGKGEPMPTGPASRLAPGSDDDIPF